MKELLLAYDEKTKEFVTLGKISDFETTPESENNDSPEAWRLKDSFSCDLILDCKINGYVWRALAGLDSNNDRRRHHVPMRRRKRGFYIFVARSGIWIWKSVSRRGHEIKAYTRYGKRTG